MCRKIFLAGLLLAWIAAPSLAEESSPAPLREEVEPWLGRYAAGAEKLELRWERHLRLRLGQIEVPVDGRWHETVATFAVRHRVTWLAEGDGLRIEEQHNEGALWRHELRLVDGGGRIEKWTVPGPEGGERARARIFRRQP